MAVCCSLVSCDCQHALRHDSALAISRNPVTLTPCGLVFAEPKTQGSTSTSWVVPIHRVSGIAWSTECKAQLVHLEDRHALDNLLPSMASECSQHRLHPLAGLLLSAAGKVEVDLRYL